MVLTTLNTTLSTPQVLCYLHGYVLDLDLLEHLGRLIGVLQIATATGTTGVIMDPGEVDFFRRKRSPLVTRMAWLAAPLAFAPTTSFASFWWRIDYVA